MAVSPQFDDFRPAATWDRLRLRAELLRRVRRFFDGRGFLEVETPVLSADTVVDRHLDPFDVLVNDPDGSGRPRRFWLQTSPEFAMKRLLAAGGEAIYQVARVFRCEERGPLHNPEFTMIEWYCVGDGPAEGMQLLSDLGEALLGRGPAELVPYADAFRRHTRVDPHEATAGELTDAASQAGIAVPASLSPDDRDGWLDLLLAECVQPNLGRGRPAILFDYPASQAALARVRPGPPPVAERFELYAAGIELANGYH
jgi:lysyl-tRNA synthetase class 2